MTLRTVLPLCACVLLPAYSRKPAEGDAAFWQAIGFVKVGPLAVRADVLEAVAAEVREAGRKGPFAVPDSVRARLACDGTVVAGFLQALGCLEVSDGVFRIAKP